MTINPDQIEAVIQEVRAFVRQADEDENDALANRASDVLKALKAWRDSGGGDPIPNADDLREWGINLPEDITLPDVKEPETITTHAAPDLSADGAGSADTADPANMPEDGVEEEEPLDHPAGSELDSPVTKADDEPKPWLENPFDTTDAPADTTTTDTPAAEAEWDPDDDHRGEYESAVALLNDGRFRAARDMFDELRRNVSGWLVEPSEAGYAAAVAGLADEVAERITRARDHAAKQPNDFVNLRKLWGRVLEIDPGDELARQAIRDLDEREVEKTARAWIEETRERAQREHRNKNYPAVLELLKQANARATANQVDSLQPELDHLVTDLEAYRDELRTELSSAGRGLVAGDFRGAYETALRYLDQGVPFVIDDQGAFGEIGEQYDTVVFLEKVRMYFLEGLRRRAEERLKKAEVEESQDPREALKTLREAETLLTDTILTAEDRKFLKDDLDQVVEGISRVEDMIAPFETTEELDEEASGIDHQVEDPLILPAEEDVAAMEGETLESEAAHATMPPTEPPAEPDPDDDLQAGYNTALDLLKNERFQAARDAFNDLRIQARGRLEEPAEEGYAAAVAGLAEAVRKPTTRAQEHAAKQPNDFVNLRKLWGRVLEIDPDDELARQAIRDLDEREAEKTTRTWIEETRDRAQTDHRRKNYPAVLEQLNQATARATVNKVESLQPELDQLVTHLTAYRDELRTELGFASTQAVSGEYRDAYETALRYLDQGVPVVIDDQGAFGEGGGLWETVEFLRLVQKRFLEGLRGRAGERLKKAKDEESQAPREALKTLREAETLLTDTILTQQDRASLKDTLDDVVEGISRIEDLIAPFETAEKLVKEVDGIDIRAEERLRLLREAKSAYKDYPDIDRLIALAEEDVAAQEAGRVENEIVTARSKLAAEEFKKALDTLAAAREAALERIPQPKEGSSLALRLADVAALESEIVAKQESHTQLLAALEIVDKFIAAKNLGPARTRLNELSEDQRNHHETKERFTQLAEAQGVGENWKQGQAAYDRANWAEAVTLLEKVADTNDAPDQAKAAFKLKRARAAQKVVEARAKEKDKEWREALNLFREAVTLFTESAGADPNDPAEALRTEADASVARLTPKEADDAVVQSAIRQAGQWLDTAEEVADKRTKPGVDLLSQIDPIPEFPRAVNHLLAAKDQYEETTLRAELEKTLVRGRTKWREANITGMKAALQSEDERILRKSIALGRELEKGGLLHQSEDRRLYETVQANYLDLQLRRYKQRPPRISELEAEIKTLKGKEKEKKANVDSDRIAYLQQELDLLRIEPLHATALIAANRKERLRIASNPDEALREEYREAIEAQVESQLAQEKIKGLKQALDYLDQEMVTPELYQNERFFSELMHLCWQAGDWRKARDRASALASRARMQDAALHSDLWQGLTTMAQHLSDGRRELFEAALKGLRDKMGANDEFMKRVEQQRRWIVEWRVDTLVEEAEKISVEEDEIRRLEAVRLYAEAHELSPLDPRVEAGLQSLGHDLSQGLDGRIQEAKRISLTGSLPDSIHTAENQLSLFTMIASVAGQLALPKDQQIALDQAIKTIQDKLEPWRTVQEQLEHAGKDIDNALVNPHAFQSDQPGGWLFDNARRLLDAAQLAARGDRPLQDYVLEEADRLQKLQERADELNQLVSELRAALEGEEFDQVSDLSERLESRWKTLHASDGFRNLDRLIRVPYPMLSRSPRTLADFRRVAQDQKTNLGLWQDWANNCVAIYKELKRLGDEQRSPLEMLAQKKSLKTIGEECKHLLNRSAVFSDALAAKPDVDPISRKADSERSQINQAMISDVGDTTTGYVRRAHELEAEVDKAIAELERGPMQRLRTAMKNLDAADAQIGRRTSLFGPVITHIPANKFAVAEQYFDEVSRVDPFNKDLSDFRVKYDKLYNENSLRD